MSPCSHFAPRESVRKPPPWERNNTFIKQNGRQDSVNLFPSTVQVVPIATRKIYCFFRQLNPLYLYKIDHAISYLFSPILFSVPSILSQSNAFIYNSWCILKIVKISSAWIFYTKRKQVLDFVRGKWNLNIFWKYVAALDVFRRSENKMILNTLARTEPLLRAQLLCPRLVAVAILASGMRKPASRALWFAGFYQWCKVAAHGFYRTRSTYVLLGILRYH